MAKTNKKSTTPEEPIEKQLWKATDKIRKNIDAAEYKHIILGLIFLKAIFDAFEALFSTFPQKRGSVQIWWSEASKTVLVSYLRTQWECWNSRDSLKPTKIGWSRSDRLG